MLFIKKIRQKLRLNKYHMGKELGFKNTQAYINFENTQYSINAQKMIRLWQISELSAQEFLEIIAQDVKQNERDKSQKTK